MTRTLTQPELRAINAAIPPEPQRFKVNIGPRRNRYFSTLDAAKFYCGVVFAATGVVLSVVIAKGAR